MTHTNGITRPPRELVERFEKIGSATASSTLSRKGLRSAFMLGPRAWTPGKVVAGPALTLRFMPKREDLYGDNEYEEPEKQLHRHVLYHTEPGDIVVVDAREDMQSGVFGEMMLTYFKGRGGAGIIVDGCVRDWTKAKHLDLGMWLRGVTPNFHTQTNIVPFEVNAEVACGGVLVLPGDIIVADDDGAVCVPAAMAEEVATAAEVHHEWEDFSKEKLASGGDLRRYYPLAEEARSEYEAWLSARTRET